MAGQNLIVHITLPKGVALTTGAVLTDDVTFDVVSSLTPFYASLDQVRLEGGAYIRRIADFTLAAEIYQASRETDQFCTVLPGEDTDMFARYVFARNSWVTSKAALSVLLNILNQAGKQAHVLGNFSVTKDVDFQKKLDDLKENLAKYEPVIKSCGYTTPGGRPKSTMAAKGAADITERTPGRTWITTGMGANATSHSYSANRGRGKTASYFYNSYTSPPFVSFRAGIFFGGQFVTIT